MTLDSELVNPGKVGHVHLFLEYIGSMESFDSVVPLYNCVPHPDMKVREYCGRDRGGKKMSEYVTHKEYKDTGFALCTPKGGLAKFTTKNWSITSCKRCLAIRVKL